MTYLERYEFFSHDLFHLAMLNKERLEARRGLGCKGAFANLHCYLLAPPPQIKNPGLATGVHNEFKFFFIG